MIEFCGCYTTRRRLLYNLFIFFDRINKIYLIFVFKFLFTRQKKLNKFHILIRISKFGPRC